MGWLTARHIRLDPHPPTRSRRNVPRRLFGTPQVPLGIVRWSNDLHATLYAPDYLKFPNQYPAIVASAMTSVLKIAQLTTGPLLLAGQSAGATLALSLSTVHPTLAQVDPGLLRRYNKLLSSGRIRFTLAASPATYRWSGLRQIGARQLSPMADLRAGRCPIAPLYFTYSQDLPGSRQTTDPVTPARTEALPYVNVFPRQCPAGTIRVDPTYQSHAEQLDPNDSPRRRDDRRPPAVRRLDLARRVPNSLNYTALFAASRAALAG